MEKVHPHLKHHLPRGLTRGSSPHRRRAQGKNNVNCPYAAVQSERADWRSCLTFGIYKIIRKNTMKKNYHFYDKKNKDVIATLNGVLRYLEWRIEAERKTQSKGDNCPNIKQPKAQVTE